MGTRKKYTSKELDEMYSNFEKKFKDLEGLKEWVNKKAHSDSQAFMLTLIRFVENECVLKGYYEGLKEGMFTKEQLEQLRSTFQ